MRVNHELIRRILSEGSSFDALTQKDIAFMMKHINSYKRKKLNNCSQYNAFSFYYGENLINLHWSPENNNLITSKKECILRIQQFRA